MCVHALSTHERTVSNVRACYVNTCTVSNDVRACFVNTCTVSNVHVTLLGFTFEAQPSNPDVRAHGPLRVYFCVLSLNPQTLMCVWPSVIELTQHRLLAAGCRCVHGGATAAAVGAPWGSGSAAAAATAATAAVPWGGSSTAAAAAAAAAAATATAAAAAAHTARQLQSPVAAVALPQQQQPHTALQLQSPVAVAAQQLQPTVLQELQLLRQQEWGEEERAAQLLLQQRKRQKQ